MQKNNYGVTIIWCGVSALIGIHTGSHFTEQKYINQAETLIVERLPQPDSKLADYFPGEFDIIKAAADRNDCTGDLFIILLAIRKAENGRAGREFGVMHPRALDTDLDTQAGWAAATVVKNYQRWQDAGGKGDFVEFLGSRYAPIGAENDPDGLNNHWVKNVKHWHKRLKNK